MATKKPSAAVLAARQRSAARASEVNKNIEWFIDDFLRRADLSLRQRVEIAVEHLKTRVVKNISRPVTKTQVYHYLVLSRKKVAGRTIVSDRSKPGEFPKADTTQLMKTIFTDIKVTGSRIEGYVGTPLDYGLILETKMDRAFLSKTLFQELDRVKRILGEPIK